MFSYFWICFASDLTDPSDSVPFNIERKWELCIIQWLGEHSLLSWISSGLWSVCSTGSFSLEADVIISVGSACSPLSAASAQGSALLGICSWSFVTSVVSGCKSQCWLQPVKPPAAFTSGLFLGKEELSLCAGTLHWHSILSIHPSAPSAALWAQRRLRVSRFNAEPAEHKGAAKQPDCPGHTGLGSIGHKQLRDCSWNSQERSERSRLIHVRNLVSHSVTAQVAVG